MSHPPFIIYALPRSGTAWAAAFLTYRDWSCDHDMSSSMRSIAACEAYLTLPRHGTVETGAAPAWQLVRKMCPGIREVCLRRSVSAVMHSFRTVDTSPVTFDWAMMQRNLEYLDRCIDKIAAQPGVMSVSHDDILCNPGEAARLFEFCLPYEFHYGWWHTMKARNIQIDLSEHLKYCIGVRDEINEFKSLLKRWMIQLVREREIGSMA